MGNEGSYQATQPSSKTLGVGWSTETAEASEAHFCLPPLRNGALGTRVRPLMRPLRCPVQCHRNTLIEEVFKFRNGGGELATVERWPNSFDELHTRVARRFLRLEIRGRVRRYLSGLLGRVERKNGWQMAEQMGEVGPQGAQRLLNAARWDADAVRDDLREYVIEHLGEEESGVLIVDETGFLKRGRSRSGWPASTRELQGASRMPRLGCSWLMLLGKVPRSWIVLCTCRARSGRTIPSGGRRLEFLMRSGLRPRVSWPKRCSDEHSRRRCLSAG